MTEAEVRQAMVDAAILIVSRMTLTEFLDAADKIGLTIHHTSST